jgi:hypothetical protein
VPRRRAVLAAGAGLLPSLAGCGSGGSESTPTSTPTGAGNSTPDDVPSGPYRYTHPQPTGNRFVAGRADLRTVDPVRLAVDGRPRWLVAHPAERGSFWTVVTDDGRATRWRVDGEATGGTRLDPRSSGAPPVVAGSGRGATLLDRPPVASGRAGQLIAPGSGSDDPPKRLYVAGNGDLLVDGRERARFPIDAPPDVRPAAVGGGRYAVYGDVTDRYGHGALGDALEPSSLVVVDASDPSVVARTTLDPPTVFEDLQPLVADLDGDGEPEIVTTVADGEDGARVAIYSPASDRLATGPVYGPGWRHVLAVARFGPDSAHELAVVLKPHVTRRLEFYRFEDEELRVRAAVDGISSHTYGSRVLGGAVAADLDDDSVAELLVPTADRRRLAVVERTAEGARLRWEWALDGELKSNVTGVGLDGGGVAVGAATADELLVWSA